jgi:hypothetical protein
VNARGATRGVAAARIAAGLTFAVAPGRIGGLLVGSDADAPGAQLFIAAFGARDLLLGTGTLAALARERRARSWVAACAAADAFDAAATLRSWAALPKRRRALTLAVSAIPAVLEAALARSLDG